MNANNIETSNPAAARTAAMAEKVAEELEADSGSITGEILFGEDEGEDELDLCTRPIIVGYAFGPKKMTTMGVVMAEASKTKLSRTATEDKYQDLHQIADSVASTRQQGDTLTSPGEADSPVSKEQSRQPEPDDDRNIMPSPGRTGELTQAVLSNYTYHAVLQQQLQYNTPTISKEAHLPSPVSATHRLSIPSDTRQNQEDTVVFTVDSGITPPGGHVGLHNIVRYFRSSCSSVADSISSGTGTCTASASSTTGSQRTASTTTRPTVSSSGSSSQRRKRQYPVRVSFVPLDMEIPFEEQHGGQMDVIIHKLTEDILCLSQLSMTHPQLKNLSQFECTTHIEKVLCQNASRSASLSASELAALRRVHRLSKFQQNHPECSLVDDPTCVQTLMSRSDIARTLQACLDHVVSTSGIPVAGPKSIVLQPQEQPELLFEQIQQAGLRYPIIVKPLIAAGTKASHAMAIILEPNPSTLPMIVTPCLCQEYSNHDSLLHKVYVLGEHVSVHKRRSLPNLPRGRKSKKGFLAFDSQRPYPRLSDFEFEDPATPSISSSIKEIENDSPRSDQDRNNENNGQASSKRRRQHKDLPKINITAEEVQPIVEALKGAFGLELFGFDVLITSTAQTDEAQRMLVVDVNYFPSYKVSLVFILWLLR